MRKLKYIVFILLLFIGINAFSQRLPSYQLSVKADGRSNKELKALVKYKTSFQDTLAVYQELNEILLQLYQQSYLTATIDSLVRDSLDFQVFLTVGESFKWVALKKGNVNEEALSKSGYRDKIFNEHPFNFKQLTRLFERIIQYYENSGYPFTVIKLDSIQYGSNEITASLKLEKNKLIRIDSITVHGKPKITDNYLYNYLSVKPGDLYNEGAIKKIGNRIQELPFVKETKPYNVAFTDTKNTLNLFLEKRNANRFDGIVGVLPNEDDGKIELTGDVKLRLLNSFSRGELIDLNWRRLANKSQDLKFKFTYPYLFNTPFGADFDFKLYRRDTLFLDIQTKYGVQYSWKANNYFEVFVNRKNSGLLSTASYKNSTVLPPFADIRSALYGVELKLERLNYRLNPRKGFAILIEVEAGSKKISKNGDLNPVIYEGLELTSSLYNLVNEIDFYFPITRSMVINLGNQSAYTFNENTFENELFRIGGLKLLRGFDEESIVASFYTVNTFEYRILLEQNSYWYLFFDGAYYENDNINLEKKITDSPIGFGTGITFQTGSGIFSLNYALGKQFNNPILFRAAKIHFGFVNYF